MAADKHRILVIPDLHIPGMREGFVDHLRDVAKKYRTNKTIAIGDVFDLASLSFHEKRTGAFSADEELRVAGAQARSLAKAFGEVDVLIGNHDDLVGRKADFVGLPRGVLRGYNDLFQLPKTWRWHKRHTQLKVGSVIFQHGDRDKGGEHAAYKNAKGNMSNLVQGHLHSQFSIAYYACGKACVWGMQCGTGIDDRNPIFDYGRSFTAKSIVGCGVVVHGTPYLEPMIL